MRGNKDKISSQSTFDQVFTYPLKSAIQTAVHFWKAVINAQNMYLKSEVFQKNAKHVFTKKGQT